MLPSPQTTVDMHGSPGVRQAKSCSTSRQSAAQPSAATLLPSSQASPRLGCKIPSPQPPSITLLPCPDSPPSSLLTPAMPMVVPLPPLPEPLPLPPEALLVPPLAAVPLAC